MTTSEQFVGLGPRRYRVERPWGKLPPGLSYSGIADVTVMASGNVAVLLRSDPALLIFTPDGALADRWSMPDVVAGHYIRVSFSSRLLLANFHGQLSLPAAYKNSSHALGFDPPGPGLISAQKVTLPSAPSL